VGSDTYGDSWQTGVGLAAGDVNGDGYDEIVATWPEGFLQLNFVDWWPFLIRNLRVLNAQNIDPVNSDLNKRRPARLADVRVQGPLEGSQPYSYLDTLAVGDLDRDLQDEIVFYQFDELQSYEYKAVTDITGTLELLSTTPSMSGVNPKVSLAMGDFTGESLRVGPPTYRVQNRLDSIVAIINMPPKHADYIKDDSGNYHLIEVLTQPCVESPTDPRCTHAKFTNKEGTVSSTTNKSQRDWMVGGGLDAKLNYGSWFVDASLKYS